MDGRVFHKQKHSKKTKTMSGHNNRFKKFVGNRTEGQGFADKRKKKIQHDYLRMLRKEKKKAKLGLQSSSTWPRMDDDEIVGENLQTRPAYSDRLIDDETQTARERIINHHQEDDIGEVTNTRPEKSQHQRNTSNRRQNQHDFKKRGMSSFSKAELEANKRKEEARRQRERKEKEKQEKETAMKNYRKQKRENYYKFHCKRTSKGQPLMKYQMEFLLKKIEKQREKEKN